MSSYLYPEDQTGTAASNKITQEPHAVSFINAQRKRILVPNYAPFFLNNLALIYRAPNGALTPMVEGVHYSLVLQFLGATRGLGRLVFGGAALITNWVDGDVLITYQTLGGEWMGDPDYVYDRLQEVTYNPLVTVWDIVTNVFKDFPRGSHQEDYDGTMGEEDLLTAVQNLTDAITTGRANAATQDFVNQLAAQHATLNHIHTIAQITGLSQTLQHLQDQIDTATGNP